MFDGLHQSTLTHCCGDNNWSKSIAFIKGEVFKSESVVIKKPPRLIGDQEQQAVNYTPEQRKTKEARDNLQSSERKTTYGLNNSKLAFGCGWIQSKYDDSSDAHRKAVHAASGLKSAD